MGVNDSESRATRYLVLRGNDRGWGIPVPVDAASAEAAVKIVAGESGVWVAVPARSWKPMRVEQVQTVQTVITAAESEPVDKIQPGPLEEPT